MRPVNHFKAGTNRLFHVICELKRGTRPGVDLEGILKNTLGSGSWHHWEKMQQVHVMWLPPCVLGAAWLRVGLVSEGRAAISLAPKGQGCPR